MKDRSQRSNVWLLPVFTGLVLLTTAAGPEGDQLPRLDENSGKGLQFHCRPAKTTFTVGEAVNVWCLVTNITDSVKSIVWHPSAGSHYCLVQGETSRMEGILPRVIPQLRETFEIKSAGWWPGYVLYLPPHASVRLLVTYKPERPERFRGRLVYDPITHGGGFLGEEALKKAQQARVVSNTLEYEVTDSDVMEAKGSRLGGTASGDAPHQLPKGGIMDLLPGGPELGEDCQRELSLLFDPRSSPGEYFPPDTPPESRARLRKEKAKGAHCHARYTLEGFGTFEAWLTRYDNDEEASAQWKTLVHPDQPTSASARTVRNVMVGEQETLVVEGALASTVWARSGPHILAVMVARPKEVPERFFRIVSVFLEKLSTYSG